MTRQELIDRLYSMSLREYENELFGTPKKTQGDVDATFTGQVYLIARRLKEHETLNKGRKQNVRAKQ